jgi:restriction system protein
MPHIVSALKALGNSGTPAEVYEWISGQLALSNEHLNRQLQSGGSHFENQVGWARFYLARAGYIDASKRGVWSLTEKGIDSDLAEKEALRIFQSVHKRYAGKQGGTEAIQPDGIDESVAPSETTQPLGDYRFDLLEIIRRLPPSAFEKLCQRLLRESGFQQVEVTGRSGDGGIDGKGLLQINPLLSMQVVFQSKRYKADRPVTVSEVRDLRGAMAGRTDKGIFITTSSFTAEARKEALREGVPPIELVDAQKLVLMFEQLELGLTQRKIYEIDRHFFEEFGHQK